MPFQPNPNNELIIDGVPYAIASTRPHRGGVPLAALTLREQAQEALAVARARRRLLLSAGDVAALLALSLIGFLAGVPRITSLRVTYPQ